MPGEELIRIVASAIVGLVFGYISWGQNIRVFILIAMGATLITITSTEYFKMMDLPWIADPGRLAAQIIAALGFIGTGLIWISENSKVKGLPVAASLWVTAILGIMIGIGQTNTLIGTFFLIFLFYFLSNVKFRIKSKMNNEDQ